MRTNEAHHSFEFRLINYICLQKRFAVKNERLCGTTT